jgi:glycosyltransferase involved in cell wall biosynthesis
VARIVHCSETLATGVLSVLSCLTRQQARDGHDVILIGSRLRKDTPIGWREELASEVQFIDLPMEREITPRADLRSALRMRSVLRELAPEVLHLHSSKAGAVGRFAALGLRTRIIYQPHGLACLRKDVSPARRAAFASIEAALALLGGVVVACSEGERAEVSKVVREQQVALVWNGIDIASVPAAQPRNGRIRIGTCGRVSAQKRPRFFAQVAEALRDVADFVWIGDGDEDGKAALTRAGVRVTGWCARSEALRELSSLQIYAQTSAWEGLPISVIEALAAGLPVVATDIVGNRDLLRGSGTGSLVHTPEEMVDALRPMIDCDELREHAGHAARRLALERFSSAAMMRGYYKLYGIEPAALSLDAADGCEATPVLTRSLA